MNAAQAKQIHLKELLERLGHLPTHEDKGEHWYLSPFRRETVASFKITRDGKGWYDHGAGQGGNLLDFVMAYPFAPFHSANDVASVLHVLTELYGQTNVVTKQQSAQTELWNPTTPPVPSTSQDDTTALIDSRAEPTFLLTKVKALQNRSLIHYLNRRGIDVQVAEPYLQEAYYQWRDKHYFALAFANASGGYELRNPYFKGCYGAKDITLLPSEAQSSAVAVFEGFMDFLSAIAYAERVPTMPILVLNSVAMRERAFASIEELGVTQLHLYLDQDVMGRKLTTAFVERFPDKRVVDESGLYEGYKDFNDFLMSKQPTSALTR